MPGNADEQIKAEEPAPEPGPAATVEEREAAATGEDAAEDAEVRRHLEILSTPWEQEDWEPFAGLVHCPCCGVFEGDHDDGCAYLHSLRACFRAGGIEW